jgi:hypothetical protein
MGGAKQWGRVIGVVAVSGLSAVVLLATPASAAGGTVAVSPAVVAVGGTVRVSGSVSTTACPLPDRVTLTSTAALFPPDGFGPVASRNAGGAFAISFSVPTSTPPGTYSIGLRCGGGNVGVSANLRVIAQVSQIPVRAPQAGFGGASPPDGRAAGWAAAGAVALVAGLLMLITVVRRRSSV